MHMLSCSPQETLGARGHLSGGDIGVTLRFFKQFIQHYPGDTWWKLLQCIPHFDHNVSSDHMLATFEMSPQSSHWGHFE